MAKSSNTRRRRTRRAGKRATQQTAQAVQGVIIGRPRSDAEYAGTVSVPSGFAPGAPAGTGSELNAALAEPVETQVTFPRFDDGVSCAVDYRDVPVEVEGGCIIHRRIAVPLRNATVGRRGVAYRTPVQPRRFIPETVEALAFPDVWTREHVLNWMGYGLAVLAMLPLGDIFPAGARAQSLPTVRELVESYGWGEVPVRETPSSTDIALMDIILTWPPRIEDEKERRALLLFCRGRTSAEISRKLGYKARAWGGKKARDAADKLAVAFNVEAGNGCSDKLNEQA